MPRAVVGDFPGLRDLVGKLDSLGDGYVEELALEAVPELREQIETNFDQGRDATGAAWPALSPETIRQGASDLAKMRASIGVYAEGRRVWVTNVDPASTLRQRGTRNMPARGIVPPADDLPLAWQAGIQRAGERILARGKMPK